MSANAPLTPPCRQIQSLQWAPHPGSVGCTCGFNMFKCCFKFETSANHKDQCTMWMSIINNNEITSAKTCYKNNKKRVIGFGCIILSCRPGESFWSCWRPWWSSARPDQTTAVTWNSYEPNWVDHGRSKHLETLVYSCLSWLIYKPL